MRIGCSSVAVTTTCAAASIAASRVSATNRGVRLLLARGRAVHEPHLQPVGVGAVDVPVGDSIEQAFCWYDAFAFVLDRNLGHAGVIEVPLKHVHGMGTPTGDETDGVVVAIPIRLLRVGAIHAPVVTERRLGGRSEPQVVIEVVGRIAGGRQVAVAPDLAVARAAALPLPRRSRWMPSVRSARKS